MCIFNISKCQKGILERGKNTHTHTYKWSEIIHDHNFGPKLKNGKEVETIIRKRKRNTQPSCVFHLAHYFFMWQLFSLIPKYAPPFFSIFLDSFSKANFNFQITSDCFSVVFCSFLFRWNLRIGRKQTNKSAKKKRTRLSGNVDETDFNKSYVRQLPQHFIDLFLVIRGSTN